MEDAGWGLHLFCQRKTKSKVANLFDVLIAKNVFALVYRTAVYDR